MKRMLPVLLCLLVGCAAQQAGTVQPPTELPPLEPPARQSLVLLVDSAADEIESQAAALFSTTVSSLTDGLFTVEVRSSAEALADFRLGEGDIVFIHGGSDSGFIRELDLLSAPMRYEDYDRFTMALNAQGMLGYLNDSLAAGRYNTTLLAAFYSSSNFFLTARPLTRGAVDLSLLYDDVADGEQDDGEEDDLAEWPVASLCSASGMAPFMVEMGFAPVIEPSLSMRLYNVVDGSAAIAEITLEELGRVDWQDSQLNLIVSGHDITPTWLAIHSDKWNNLPSKYRSVMQEAVAYIFPAIDGSLLEQQEDRIALLRENSVTVDRNFPALQNAADAIYAGDGELPFRERYLYELLTGME